MPIVEQLAGEYASRVKFAKVNCLSEMEHRRFIEDGLKTDPTPKAEVEKR